MYVAGLSSFSCNYGTQAGLGLDLGYARASEACLVELFSLFRVFHDTAVYSMFSGVLAGNLPSRWVLLYRYMYSYTASNGRRAKNTTSCQRMFSIAVDEIPNNAPPAFYVYYRGGGGLGLSLLSVYPGLSQYYRYLSVYCTCILVNTSTAVHTQHSLLVRHSRQFIGSYIRVPEVEWRLDWGGLFRW